MSVLPSCGWLIRSLCALALLTLTAASAFAQIGQGPALPRLDVAAAAGWLWHEIDTPGHSSNAWPVTWTASAMTGVYWGEHLKLEIEAGRSGTRRRFSGESVPAPPGETRFVYYETAARSTTWGVTPVYQFRRNAWVHPFAGLGLSLDWETRHLETRTQRIPGIGSRVPYEEGVVRSTERRLRARANAVAGLKVYVSRRAFLRTDLQIGFARATDRVAWRFGAGVDF
jgi:hypothetical protein